MNKSRKFGKEILSHFREITLFVGGHFLSAPCTCIHVCNVTYLSVLHFSIHFTNYIIASDVNRSDPNAKIM